ncbi:hypothetical protein [Neptunicoccus cionae]|uniref:Bacteriophage tail tape measure N-terminal domain-containing protein n=1 Tax=Neptunicoccus cionae TaxID=2035344 RepID=A0A916R165_9RHOB|nr:hypothetical protein [Amylibacter cionae]GGA23914.1 hypothetical protein GCM10011498_26060 [Amylibacter cionae]
MANQNIGKLGVSIGADTSDLARGIGRAKALMGSLSRAAKVSGVAAGAAFAAASAGMVAMTKGGLSAVDAQAKMARSVDGTIDGLRALQIAGSDAGVAVGEMNGAVQMMGKRLAEAATKGTGPAAKALKMLGLDARTLMDMDVDARFGAIADRINDMGMSAQDAAGVMREFGVRSNEVSLALLQGSGAIRAARTEVQKYGLSMSGDMAAGVEAANDALSRVSFVFEGMRNQLAVGLAPVLRELAVNFQAASVAGGPLQAAVSTLVEAFGDLARAILDPAFIEAAAVFGTTIARGVAALSRGLVALIDHAELAGAAMIALGAAMAFFSGPIGLAVAAVAGGVFLLSTRLGENATAADEATTAEKELLAALETVDTANGDAVASGRELIATHISQARAAITAAQAEYELARAETDRAVQQAKMRREAMPGNLFADDEVEQAEDDAALAAEVYSQMIADRQADLERLQKVMQGFEMSQYPARGTRPVGSDNGGGGGGDDPLGVSKLNTDLQKLIATIDPAASKAKQLAAAMQLLTKAKQEGVITDAEYILRAKQINEAFGETPKLAGAAAAGVKSVKDTLDDAGTAGGTLAEDLNGAFGNLINQIESGREALVGFGLEIVKILAVRGISKILGGDDWFSGSLIGNNALGTDNWRGGLSWVGERGPELVNLPMGAQVIPNNKIGSMGGGGMRFSYAPNIDARGASVQAVQELDQRMRADAAQFNGKVQQAVLKAQSGRKL